MKKYIWLLLFIGLGCKHEPPAPAIRIDLTDGGRSLKISGMDPVVLADIDRDSIASWQSLFAIYRMPKDTDAKDYQPIQPGRYQLKDSSIIYTPDTPFAKQQTYFLRHYDYAGNKDIWDYIRGKTTKGQLHYTDLGFKGQAN